MTIEETKKILNHSTNLLKVLMETKPDTPKYEYLITLLFWTAVELARDTKEYLYKTHQKEEAEKAWSAYAPEMKELCPIFLLALRYVSKKLSSEEYIELTFIVTYIFEEEDLKHQMAMHMPKTS